LSWCVARCGAPTAKPAAGSVNIALINAEKEDAWKDCLERPSLQGKPCRIHCVFEIKTESLLCYPRFDRSV
jgi:hypothetical protein